MTRKEYAAIVEKISAEYRRTDNSLRETTLLHRLIPQVGEAISANGGRDINGNRRFTIEGFVFDVTGDRNLSNVYAGQTTARENPYRPPTWSDMLGEKKD